MQVNTGKDTSKTRFSRAKRESGILIRAKHSLPD